MLSPPEERIAALLQTMLDASRFVEEELVALERVDRMGSSGHAVSDELYSYLKELFNDGDIEPVGVIGLFNHANRMNDTLRTEIAR